MNGISESRSEYAIILSIYEGEEEVDDIINTFSSCF
jgi:hypothetical protein